MKRLHIVGGKNHGKTTFLVELVQELISRKLRVATIKHTHHRHELDTPGKDSHRHRIAGSEAVGIISQGLNAVFWETDAQGESPASQYGTFETFFAHMDLLLVEGDLKTTAPKIEVWRAACGTTPLAEHDPSIRAVITDDPLEISTTILSRSHLQETAIWIKQTFIQNP